MNAIMSLPSRLEISRRALSRPCRVILGAGGISNPEGWIPTEKDALNLLIPDNWQACFRPASIDALLAEHVWEHLTEEEGLQAARLCRKYLQPGGYLRIAVPDGCRPDSGYIEHARPGGTGAGASDHKVLYTYKSLGTLLQKAGFDAELLEYHDELGNFRHKDWDARRGRIVRSMRFDPRNTDGVLRYTSIIMDAWKAPRPGT